jgi:hypothetical protein
MVLIRAEALISGSSCNRKLGGQEAMKKGFLAPKLFGLFGFVKESSDLYFFC